jgi:hypothetical protein
MVGRWITHGAAATILFIRGRFAATATVLQRVQPQRKYQCPRYVSRQKTANLQNRVCTLIHTVDSLLKLALSATAAKARLIHHTY